MYQIVTYEKPQLVLCPSCHTLFEARGRYALDPNSNMPLCTRCFSLIDYRQSEVVSRDWTRFHP